MVDDKRKENELATIALRAIMQMLYRREITPGMVLSQRKLAAQLGMSYQPVSIALKRLEFEGIIISRARSGSQVALLGLHDYWEVIQERISIEQRAIQLACRYASDEELKSLIPLADAADVINEDPVYLNNDDRFHRALTSWSHSQLLTRTMTEISFFRIKGLLCPDWGNSGVLTIPPNELPTGTPYPKFGHMALLELILERDEDAAMARLDCHICPLEVYPLIFPEGRRDGIQLPLVAG